MNKLFVFAELVVLILCGCKEQSTESKSIPKFAIYKLADTNITDIRAHSLSLDSLILSRSPFLTENDLIAYYWSDHSFNVRSNIDTVFAQMRWLSGKSRGVPFVVIAAGTRIYLGSFWWAYSSSMPMGAYILMGSSSPYAIQYGSLASVPDMRGDHRIYNALKAAGVLVE